MDEKQSLSKNHLLDLLSEDQKNIELFSANLIDKEAFSLENKKISQKLKSYISTEGFPFKNKVSYDIYKAAVVLLLHTDPEYLQGIEEIFIKANIDEVDSEHKAFFIDKSRIYNGKEQLYGTQFKRISKDQIEFLPIENIDTVDIRRKSLGLSSLQEYKNFAENK